MVVTADFRRSASTYQLEGPAVCVPLISSTGHGDAAIHRVHYQEGKFALANLLVALLPNDSSVCNAKYLYHLLMARKDELLVPLRIVAQIESLVAKIDEAKGLRHKAVKDEERLLICMAHREDLSTNEKLRSGWFETIVGSICRFTDESESVDGSRNYPNLGIFSYGRGVFPKPSIDGVTTSAQTLRRVRAGQFIYSRLFAFEGAYAMVPSELDGYYVSGEYPTFTCDPTKACAEFLWSHFRSPNVWQTVAVGSKGLGNRRQRVQPDRVLEYRLWVPPMEWQRKIQSVQAKVDALKGLQTETADELAALLPSILDKAFKGEL